MNSKQAWANPNLQIAKLIDVDPKTGRKAQVMITDNDGNNIRLNVKVTITKERLTDFIELSRYGDTAFLDGNHNLVAWSGLSIWNGTLSQPLPGVDVYE